MALKFGRTNTEDFTSKHSTTEDGPNNRGVPTPDEPVDAMKKKIPLWVVLVSIPLIIIAIPIALRVCVLIGRVVFRLL